MRQPTIIFDLDGVILSERPYWRAASDAVGDVLAEFSVTIDADRPAIGIVPPALIDRLKAQGVNSNWELSEVLAQAGVALGGTASLSDIETLTNRFFADFAEVRGHGVMAAWAGFVAPRLAAAAHGKGFRDRLHRAFQARLGAAPTDPAVDPPRLRRLMARLIQSGVVLGIATGRPEAEALAALNANDLTRFFDPRRIVTFDQVASAQRVLGRSALSKPHPFCLLWAAEPGVPIPRLCDDGFQAEPRPWLTYIGDAVSDLLTAQAARATPAMVLSGCADPANRAERERTFRALGAGVVHADVLEALDAVLVPA